MTITSRKKLPNFNNQVNIVACYFEYHDRYLFLKRSAEESHKNTWGVPAGKIESHETPQEALIREVHEETDIVLDNNNLKDLGKLYVRYPAEDFIYYMFYISLKTIPEVHLSSKHVDYRWVTTEEVAQLPLIPDALEALEDVEQAKHLLWYRTVYLLNVPTAENYDY